MLGLGMRWGCSEGLCCFTKVMWQCYMAVPTAAQVDFELLGETENFELPDFQSNE